MIIVSAGEGLGNQMFEYAFYLKLKKVYPDVVIKLDPVYAFAKSHNGYEVERIFGLGSLKATKDEVYALADVNYLENTGHFLSIYSKVIRKTGIHKKSFLIQKDRTAYYDDFLNLDKAKSYYLYGPFANSKYFADIKEEVISAFSFPVIEKDQNEVADHISKAESVAIHVRRGDYISWGVELTGSDYYIGAITKLSQIINRDISEMDYFIFSDDVNAAKDIFKDIPNVHIVSGNDGDRSYMDMQLMSMCKHNIITNSTFGFWGAYLNENINKVVIGPKIPFTGFKYPFTCDGWVQI